MRDLVREAAAVPPEQEPRFSISYAAWAVGVPYADAWAGLVRREFASTLTAGHKSREPSPRVRLSALRTWWAQKKEGCNG